MKNTFTLFAFIGLTLSTWAQSPSQKQSDQHFSELRTKVNHYNTWLRTNSSAIRLAPTIQLDSIISSKIDTLDNSWSKISRADLTFYPNGLIKTYTDEYLAEKITVFYNQQGYQTQLIRFKYELGNWVEDSKEELIYNNANLPITYKYFIYNNSISNWELNYTENKIYDTSNNLLTTINSRKNGSIFENEDKKELAYNSNNLPILEAYYRWKNNAWFPLSKTEGTYDANGNKLSETWSMTDSTTLIKQRKEEYTYTTFDEPEMGINYEWDTTFQLWTKMDSTWKVYNSTKLLATDTTFRWTGLNWEFNNLNEYAYNQNGQILLEENKLLNMGLFQVNTRTVYQYDAANRRVLYENYFRNDFDNYLTYNYKSENFYSSNGDFGYNIHSRGQDSSWIALSKYENYFDPNTQVDDIVPNNWFWWKPFQLLRSKSYHYTNNQSVLADTTAYYYSDIINSIPSIENETVTVYPNPTTGILILSGEIESGVSLDLVNMAGEIVRTYVSTSSNLRVNISNLVPGVYFLRIQNKNGVIIKKVLKQ